MSAIGMRLYSKELIPKETYENIITSNKSGRDKANSLLLTLETTVEAQPWSLKKFIELLRKNKVFRAIADNMDKGMCNDSA